MTATGTSRRRARTPTTTSPGFLPEREVLEQASAVLSDLTDIDADGVAAVRQRR